MALRMEDAVRVSPSSLCRRASRCRSTAGSSILGRSDGTHPRHRRERKQRAKNGRNNAIVQREEVCLRLIPSRPLEEGPRLRRNAALVSSWTQGKAGCWSDGAF